MHTFSFTAPLPSESFDRADYVRFAQDDRAAAMIEGKLKSNKKVTKTAKK